MGRLIYHKDNFLSLELQYKKDEGWQPCFNIPNVTLPTVTYLGFSAHTGEVSGISRAVFSLMLDNHDIISVETRTIYSLPIHGQGRPDPKQGSNEQIKGKGISKPPKNLPKGDSFGMALLRVIGVLVIMGLLYFGWTAYRVRQGDRF